MMDRRNIADAPMQCFVTVSIKHTRHFVHFVSIMYSLWSDILIS